MDEHLIHAFLNRVDFNKRKDFLRRIVGFHNYCFTIRNTNSDYSKSIYVEKNYNPKVKKVFSIGYLIDKNEEYFIYSNLKEKVLFGSIAEPKKIPILSFICSLEIPDEILQVFMFIIFQDMIFYFNKTIFYEIFNDFINKDWIPRFILGAGVGVDYGSCSWTKLINEFKNKISVSGQNFDVDSLNKMIFDNSYGIPQILKDINYSVYKQSLYDSIYTYNAYQNYITNNNSIYYYIANILYKFNKVKGIDVSNVLSFNYDLFLEHELNKMQIQTSSNSNKNDVGCDYGVNINHVHGYIFYQINTTNKTASCLFRDIVLNNDEYKNAYSSNKTFVVSSLRKQLSKTCIFIGNSVVDYEEQKIINAIYSKNISIFHFIILKANGNIANNLYITKHFLKMGLLVLWIDDYFEIKKILNKIELHI